MTAGKCDKCGGLWITDGDETRCVNCGRRPAASVSGLQTGIGIQVLRSPSQEEERDMVTCTKKGCANPPAPDSVQCVKHRDQQRKSNENFAKKNGYAVPKTHGRIPKSERIASLNRAASPAPTGEESWSDLRMRLLDELEDADKKLREKLDAILSAQGAIRAL